MKSRYPNDPAVGTIVARTEAGVRRIARALVSDDSLQDEVVQVALFRAWKHAELGEPLSYAWLKTVVRNAASRLITSEQRRHRLSRELALRVEASGDIPSVPVGLLADLDLALADLTDESQQILTLRFRDGLTSQEIGDRLGLKTSAVRMRIMRALDRLRARLDDDYGRRDAWIVPLLFQLCGHSSIMGVISRSSRPRLATVASCMLVVAIGIVTTIAVTDDAGPVLRSSGAPEEGRATARRAEQPVEPPVAPAEPEASPIERKVTTGDAVALRGTFKLVREGQPLDGPIRIEVSRRFRAPEYREAQRISNRLGFTEEEDGFRPAPDGRPGVPYHVPVDAAGVYYVRCSVPGVVGETRFVAYTQTPFDVTMTVASQVEVELDPLPDEPCRLFLLDYRLNPIAEFERKNDRTWLVEECVLPVPISLVPGGRSQAWNMVLSEHRSRLMPPSPEMREIVLVDRVSRAPIAGAKIFRWIEGRDRRSWQAVSRTSPDGTTMIPDAPGVTAQAIDLPDGSTHRFDALGWLQSLPLDRGRPVLSLDARSGGGTLLDSANDPVTGARVTWIRGNRLLAARPTGPDGEFVFAGSRDLMDGSGYLQGDVRRPDDPVASDSFLMVELPEGSTAFFREPDPRALNGGTWIGTLSEEVEMFFEAEDAATGDLIADSWAGVYPEFIRDPRHWELVDRMYTPEEGVIGFLVRDGHPRLVNIQAEGYDSRILRQIVGAQDRTVVLTPEESKHGDIGIRLVDEAGQPRPGLGGTLVKHPEGRIIHRGWKSGADGRIVFEDIPSDWRCMFFLEHRQLSVSHRNVPFFFSGGPEVDYIVVPRRTVGIRLDFEPAVERSQALLLVDGIEINTYGDYVRLDVDAETVSLTSERHALAVLAPRVRPAMVEWDPSQEETDAPIRFALRAGASLSARLRDAAGAPVEAEYSLRALGLEGASRQWAGALKINQALFTLDGAAPGGKLDSGPLAPGTWRIEVTVEGAVVYARDVEVADRDLDLGVVTLAR